MAENLGQVERYAAHTIPGQHESNAMVRHLARTPFEVEVSADGGGFAALEHIALS